MLATLVRIDGAALNAEIIAAGIRFTVRYARRFRQTARRDAYRPGIRVPIATRQGEQ